MPSVFGKPRMSDLRTGEAPNRVTVKDSDGNILRYEYPGQPSMVEHKREKKGYSNPNGVN